jgi:DNA-binding MarR family transcriptional regulator
MASLKSELLQNKDFESLEQETYLNLQRTVGILNGPFLQLFKQNDLRHSLYNILRILRGQKGQGLACSHIAERMVTRDPDVTRLIDKLMKKGLVQRHRSDTDRRVVLISITEEGMNLLDEMDGPVKELHHLALGHMTRAELEELNRLLVKARHPDKGEG